MNCPTVCQVDFSVPIPNEDGKGVAYSVTVQIPVIIDEATGEEILTPEAHELIESTQARHMGLMLPDEIRVLRHRFKLTQKELGELLQVGEKSFSRWESGRDRPSRSINLLLCALRDDRLTISYLEQRRRRTFNWRVVHFEQPIVLPEFQQADTEPGFKPNGLRAA